MPYGNVYPIAPGLGVFLGVMKASGISNSSVNAGYLSNWNTAVNLKANGINRQYGDFSYAPTGIATMYDPDLADGNMWNAGGFF